jgi:large subunit ribosomal protein L23
VIQKLRSTEKIVRGIEIDNTLVFECDLKMKKTEIKEEFEKLFNAKVESVNTHIKKNKKIAYIKLKSEFSAADIATKLGAL